MAQHEGSNQLLLINRGQLLVGLLLLAFSTVIVAVIFFTLPQATPAHYDAKFPRVEVINVTSQKLSLPLIFRGVLVPKQQLALQASVAGEIVSLGENFVSGGHFNKGEMLFRLDDHRLKMELAKSRAHYEQAKLEELTLIVRLDSYKKNATEKPLSQLAKGEPQRAAAAAATAAAKAAFEFAQSQLNKAQVIAPFNGRVKRQQHQLHEYVPQGAVIAHIYADDSYVLRLPVTEQQRHLLPLLDIPSSPITVQVYDPQFPEQQYPAAISAYEAYISKANRLSHLIVEMNAVAANIYPGSLLEVAIASKKFDGVTVLDATWLRSHNQVWLVDENQHLKVREVEVLFRAKDKVYISTGLKVGDRLITSHLSFVSDGMSVDVAAD